MHCCAVLYEHFVGNEVLKRKTSQRFGVRPDEMTCLELE